MLLWNAESNIPKMSRPRYRPEAVTQGAAGGVVGGGGAVLRLPSW